MAVLPNLPAPPPQLDFPAMEQERQALVAGYNTMTQAMLAALSKKMDDFVQEGVAVKSAPVSYQQGAKAPQLSRRDKIASVLVRTGVDPDAFQSGGCYEHTSDNALYQMAEAAVALRRKGRATKT